MTTVRGLVFNIQRFSVDDGPGIRTTVFLKGCPLSCLWCHNPEAMAPRPEIVVAGHRCIACGECVKACPLGLPVPVAGAVAGAVGEAPDACRVCGACVEACPTEARQMVGREMTVEEVLAEVLRDRLFYDESGGGVTFSGGEPLRQPEFLRQALAACRERGLHTAVDTCGLASWEELRATAALTDLFLYDVKHPDDRRHRTVTGVSNTTILDNLRRLGQEQSRIWLRVPVVPGVNDDPADLEATARLAAEVPAVERVCLLPYHPLGDEKLRRWERPRTLTGVAPPSAEKLARLAGLVEARGVATTIGG